MLSDLKTAFTFTPALIVKIKFPEKTIFPRDREIKDLRNVPRKFSQNLSPAKIKENKVFYEYG